MQQKSGQSKAKPAVKSRVTLNDVAREAGVHRSTVSQVLNDWPNCWASDKTRERIRKAAKKLSYRPNLSARALRSGKSHVIGLAAPGFLTGMQSHGVGLSDAAAEAGYTVTLSSHSNDSDAEDLVIRRLLDRGMDGLVVYPVDTGPHDELRRLVASGFPVVTFEGANLLDFESDDISVDCEPIARLQVQHLLSLDRRRICLASVVPNARINAIWENAARRELAQAGAPPAIEMKLPCSAEHEIADPQELMPGMRAFLRDHHGAFDGLIAISSLASMAIGLLHESGLHVPDDVAVVTTGSGALVTYGSLPMTSVETSSQNAGGAAFKLLMDRIEGRDVTQFRRLMHAAELIVRKSTRG